MELAQKKDLRILKLRELYNFNEDSGGSHKMITYNNLRENREEKNQHLALEYLADHGYISYERRANNLFNAKITSHGIDYVENNM